MTIREAIEAVDALVTNVFTEREKIEWLSALDGMIKTEIIDTHEGAENVIFLGYDPNTVEEGTVLLAPEPYARELYVTYLQSKMDYYNGESRRYNNSLAAFEAAYTAFARWYHKTHLPISKKRKYW